VLTEKSQISGFLKLTEEKNIALETVIEEQNKKVIELQALLNE
jgi:hypothetical protein